LFSQFSNGSRILRARGSPRTPKALNLRQIGDLVQNDGDIPTSARDLIRVIQDSLSKRYLAAYRTPLPNNWLRTELIAASQQSGRLSLALCTQAARQVAEPAGNAVTCPLNLTSV
jgi:hypothetical protein